MSTRMVNKTALQPFPSLWSPTNLVNLARRSSRSKFRVVQVALVLTDALILALAFWIAFQARFSPLTVGFFDPTAWQDVAFYTLHAYFLIPVWLLLFRAFKLYDRSIVFSGHQEYTNIFNACTIGIMLLIVLTFLDPTLVIARGWLVLSWVLTIVLIGLERFTMRRIVYAARHNGHFMTPTYIVGANPEGIAIAEHLSSASMFGINVIGFLDDQMSVGQEVLPGIAVHGPTQRAEELCHKFGIERLIVATSGVEREHLQSMFKSFINDSQISVWLSSGMYEMLTTGVRVQDIGSMAMISINRVRLTGLNMVMKRIIDYVGAILGLIALSPLFLAIYIIMKRTDPGPVFHRRRVVGVGGKEFDAFKFRTMIVNADVVLQELLDKDPEARAEFEANHKLKHDPRITKVGAFLRKTSVDELPQLLNVLRGEMSLVGPRMITPEEVKKYGQWDMNIHTVMPGITGLWQISGRSDISYAERVRIDMHYIRNYSIWLDLQILFWTIPSVLMSKGAY